MLPDLNPIYQGKLDNFCAIYAVINGLKLISNINNMQARIVLNEALYYESLDARNWLRVINHETDYQALVSRMLKKWESMFEYGSFCPFDATHYPQNIFQRLAQHDMNARNAEQMLAMKARQKHVQNAHDSTQTVSVNQGHTNQNTTQDIPKKTFIERLSNLFRGETFDINKAFQKPELSVDLVWSTIEKHILEGKSTVVLRLCRFLPDKIGPMVDHWTTVYKITDDKMFFYDCSLEKTGWYQLPRQKVFIAPFGSILPQTLALQDGFKLSLMQGEFAVLCPEYIHVMCAN